MENRQIPTGSPGYVPIQQKDKQYTLQNLLNNLLLLLIVLSPNWNNNIFCI